MSWCCYNTDRFFFNINSEFNEKDVYNPTTFLRRFKWWYPGSLTGPVDLHSSLAAPLSRCACLLLVHNSVSWSSFRLQETRTTKNPGVCRHQFRAWGHIPSVVELGTYLNKDFIWKITIVPLHYDGTSFIHVLVTRV